MRHLEWMKQPMQNLKSILKEAAAVAESSTGQMFPSVPTDTQVATTSKYI